MEEWRRTTENLLDTKGQTSEEPELELIYTGLAIADTFLVN